MQSASEAIMRAIINRYQDEPPLLVRERVIKGEAAAHEMVQLYITMATGDPEYRIPLSLLMRDLWYVMLIGGFQVIYHTFDKERNIGTIHTLADQYFYKGDDLRRFTQRDFPLTLYYDRYCTHITMCDITLLDGRIFL